jgi:alpha-ketoglutarate-dependent sulfate ester dioxygenase
MAVTELSLDIRPLTPRTGAEVCDVELVSDLDDTTVSAIRAALLHHKVLFFRAQRLDQDAQVALAARFGPLTTAHPTVPGVEGYPILELDADRGGRANSWHTDVTFVDRPPLGAVLRAVVIPDSGGDTLWANTALAYETLPQDLRDEADAAWAVHTNGFDYAEFNGNDQSSGGRRYSRAFTSIPFETHHPVVRVHPETGERSLLLGAFARRILDRDDASSTSLLRALQAHITKPEHTVRWRWRHGDVVMWDNRATQHYAVNDYGSAPRKVQRVTWAGSIPVGVDGRRSVAVEGDASGYSALPD